MYLTVLVLNSMLNWLGLHSNRFRFGGNIMRQINIKYLVISFIIVLVSIITVNIYTVTYGYPWKHAEVKKEAVGYMKNKYNMDVKVARSTFNSKFDYYIVEVFEINDGAHININVEKQKFHDDNGQYKGERLEDNYSKVYWEIRLRNELQAKYSDFFALLDIEKMQMDIAYFTTPLESGVSSIKDENGIFIPLKPDNNSTLDVDLNTKDFSEEFLKGLLLVIRDLVNKQLKVDLFITGKSTERTKLINLRFEEFTHINSLDDLKKEVSDF